jgi:hypothetical protein
MSTLLADPPAATSPQQPSAPESSGAAPAPAPAAAERKCKKCGAAMEGAQEWCLQCGTPAPGSLGTHTPSWRSGAIVLAATALLALGAAGAAYAALTKTKVRHVVVVQVPAATAPAAATPPPAATPTTPATTATPQPAVPTTAVKPPKIPVTASTPTSTTAPKATTTPPPAKTTPTTTPKSTAPKKAAAGNPTAALPPALLLDTNSVATYNPEGYPVETFGDPTLTVDGDTSTGWTAQVNPAIAPKMAVGLLIDLNAAKKLSALQLITSTPGMTVQVFGTAASTAPAAITDPGWTALSPHKLQKERHTLIKLSDSTKAFGMLALWITGAPPASIGTPTSPGRVSVNEVEVFPAK